MIAAMLIKGLQHAVLGSLILGALSALGDWIWANYLTDGAVLPGVIHGALIFLIMALILGRGAPAGRFLLWSLPLAGILLAAVFYPLAYAVGYLGALLITWAGMWLIIAALHRLALGGREGLRRAVVRGLVAAIASGLAFWAISGIWTKPSPDGPNYAWHFFCWTFAYFPGLAALLWSQPGTLED